MKYIIIIHRIFQLSHNIYLINRPIRNNSDNSNNRCFYDYGGSARPKKMYLTYCVNVKYPIEIFIDFLFANFYQINRFIYFYL